MRGTRNVNLFFFLWFKTKQTDQETKQITNKIEQNKNTTKILQTSNQTRKRTRTQSSQTRSTKKERKNDPRLTTKN
jgi:hypothetical protein